MGQLSRLGGAFDPPPTVVHWDEKTIDGEKHGALMRADPLSIDPSDNIGSKPSDAATKLWDVVRKVPRGGASWYIQGHLLNHNLHGPGIWKNMAPIARTTNTKMEREDDGTPTPGGVEHKLKHAILDEHKVVCYEVRMVYGKHSGTPATVAEGKLPSRVEMYAVQLVFRRGKWVPTSKVIAKKTLENEIRTK